MTTVRDRPEHEVEQVTHRTARNVAYATVAEIAGKVGAFAFLVVGTRALSQGDFGAFSYAYAFAMLVTQLPLWGFDPVVTREASQHPEQLPRLVAESHVWRAVVGVPVFVGAAIVGVFTQPSDEAAAALVAVLLAVFLDTAMRTGISAAAAEQRLGRIAVAQLVRRVVMAVAGGVAIALGFGLLGYSGALLLGSIVGIAAVWLAVRLLPVRADFSAVRWTGLRAMGIASIPLGVDVLVSGALFKVDALMLGSIKGEVALAPYAVAYRLVETALFVAYAVVTAVFPVMSAARTSERVRVGIERATSVCAAAYIPFAVAALMRGGDIVRLLFGARYGRDASVLVAWLAFAPLLVAYGNLANAALVSRRRVVASVLASTAAAVFNVGVNAVVIPVLGAEGAAITTTASYVFEAIILTVLCIRTFGVPRIDLALVESVVAGLVMAAVLAVLHTEVAVDIVVASLVYGVTWLFVSYRFSRRNVEVLRAFMRRVTPDDGTAASGIVSPMASPGQASAPAVVTNLVEQARKPARRAVAAGSVVAVVGAALILGVALAAIATRTSPLLVVVLPAAGLWFAAVLQRPLWGVAAFFVLLPFSLIRLPVGGLQVIDLVALGGVVATLLARIAVSNPVRARMPAALGWGAALCGLAAVSTASALDTGDAIDQLIVLVVGFLFACAVVSACQRFRDIRLLLAAFLVSGTVMAVAAFGNATQVKSIGGVVVQSRSTGLFVDPNELGSFAAMLILVALGVVVSGRRGLRVVAVGAVILGTVALVLSLSRGAWLGTGLGLLALGVLVPRAWRLLGAVAVIGLLLGLVVGAFQPSAPEVRVVKSRFGDIFDSTANPYEGRPEIWAEARREIKTHPLLGVGPGNFPVASARSDSASQTIGAVHAHDVLLTVGAELGLLAVLVLVAFTFAVGRAAWRATRALGSSPDRAIVGGVAAALVAFMGHGILDFTLRNATLMVLVWALAGMVLASDRLVRAGVLAPAR